LPPGDQIGVGVDDAEELPEKPALADAGDPDQRDELGLMLDAGTCERLLQQLELTRAADERRARVLDDVDAEARADPGHLPGCDRLALALGGDRIDGADLGDGL